MLSKTLRCLAPRRSAQRAMPAGVRKKGQAVLYRTSIHCPFQPPFIKIYLSFLSSLSSLPSAATGSAADAANAAAAPLPPAAAAAAAASAAGSSAASGSSAYLQGVAPA